MSATIIGLDDYSGNGSGSGSGSGYGQRLSSPLWGILIAFSPLILVMTAIILCTCKALKDYILTEIKECLRKCKDTPPIVNGKLSNKYIKTLNANNLTDKIKQNMDPCAICIEKITLNNITVTLLCGHTFHTKCLQQWVKKQTSEYNNPSCPLDRTVIIEIPKVWYNDQSYSSDSNSDYD